MAKHRKNRRRGFGSVITVNRGFNGLLDTGTVVGDALPVVLGGALVLGTQFAIGKLLDNSSETSVFLKRYAHMLGAAAASLAGLGLVYGMGKRTAGTTLIASGVTLAGSIELATRVPIAPVVVVPAAAAPAGAVSGFGAIVPQFGAIVPQFGAVAPTMNGVGSAAPYMNGLGATVMQDWPAGDRPDSIGGLGAPYGAEINLSGLGAVNTSAFGTPGFPA